jgi:excisionase family DNA binding protein
MSSLNIKNLFQLSIPQVIDNHITVKTASEITGYNAQYLRRLLRARRLEAIKIGQVWLINLFSMENIY